jgi:hypothetical protein
MKTETLFQQANRQGSSTSYESAAQNKREDFQDVEKMEIQRRIDKELGDAADINIQI